MAHSSLNRACSWIASTSARACGALLLILAIFIWSVETWKPKTFFGRYQHDAIYFSSAQDLAQHQGYILPSFPGVCLQPKYPVLYLLLLSGVWKAWPEFPNNVIWAIRLTECFGCLALLRTFSLLRCVGWTEFHRRSPRFIHIPSCHEKDLRLTAFGVH
jgi:hypothetical protein